MITLQGLKVILHFLEYVSWLPVFKPWLFTKCGSVTWLFLALQFFPRTFFGRVFPQCCSYACTHTNEFNFFLFLNILSCSWFSSVFFTKRQGILTTHHAKMRASFSHIWCFSALSPRDCERMCKDAESKNRHEELAIQTSCGKGLASQYWEEMYLSFQQSSVPFGQSPKASMASVWSEIEGQVMKKIIDKQRYLHFRQLVRKGEEYKCNEGMDFFNQSWKW